MTKPRKPARGMKLVTGDHKSLYEVPSDAIVGELFSMPFEKTLNAGAGCIIGQNVHVRNLDSAGVNFVVGDSAMVDCQTIGNDVSIGTKSIVTCWSIGNNVTIGENCTIHCRLPDDTIVGDNVTLGKDTVVQPGIKFPDNWLIPQGGYVVNPGIDGYPVAFAPLPQQFHCNVTAASRPRDW